MRGDLSYGLGEVLDLRNRIEYVFLGAIKKLRNYGKGFVNFGEPIHLNQYLNDKVPDWKDDIDPIDPQKPSWLTPTVNGLGDVLMTKINKNRKIVKN